MYITVVVYCEVFNHKPGEIFFHVIGYWCLTKFKSWVTQLRQVVWIWTTVIFIIKTIQSIFLYVYLYSIN